MLRSCIARLEHLIHTTMQPDLSRKFLWHNYIKQAQNEMPQVNNQCPVKFISGKEPLTAQAQLTKVNL